MSQEEQPDQPGAQAQGHIPRIVAVTGGKGGVGKTSVAVNLAIALARLQHRVCLLDGDTGLANVNILLGLQPEHTLEHLISGHKRMREILLPGPEGLQIVPGASGVSRCAELENDDQASLLRGLRQLEQDFDWLLVDTAAGISTVTTRMIDAAQQAAVVITPEPTSLTDAFSLLKTLHRNGYRRRVMVIVNMVSSSEQPQAIYRRFQAAVQKYIGLDSEYLGSIWMDESMRVAVASQRPVATLPLHDPSCRLFMRLADSLVAAVDAVAEPRRSMADYWQTAIDANPAAADIHPLPAPPANSNADPAPENRSASLVEQLQQQIASADLAPGQLLDLLDNALHHPALAALTPRQRAQLRALLDSEGPDFDQPDNTIGSAAPDNEDPGDEHEHRADSAPGDPEPEAEDTPLPPASDEGSAPPPAFHPQELQTAVPVPASHPQGDYDNERFGPQDRLAEKIRNLDDSVSLDEFLARH